MAEDKPHPYYSVRRDLIAAAFRESLDMVGADFARLLPEQLLDGLIPQIMEEFDRVLARIPYVGGDKGRMTPFFEANVGIIALGRVLRERGVPFELNSELMKNTYLAKLSSLSEEERRELGRQWVSRESQQYLREEARKSNARESAGDFVYEYVDAGVTEEGEAFEFGLDYHECGFCKLCKAEGDEDLLPAICAMDKEVYAIRGVELFRSTTIAGGHSHCNFRFRRQANANDGKETGE